MPCLLKQRLEEKEQSSSRDIFKRANRFLSRDREGEDGSPVPTRYFERGHPLPANHSPERKATIPFRNPDLGLPSYRRRSNNFSYEAMSGLSPQRYMSYSNFRRGTANPVQALVPADLRTSLRRGEGNRAVRPIAEVQPHGHRTSHTSSRQASGKCTPSRRRDSVVTRTTSPSRSSGTNKLESPLAPPTKEAPPRAPTDTAWILKSCIRISNQSRVRQSQISPKKGTLVEKTFWCGNRWRLQWTQTQWSQ